MLNHHQSQRRHWRHRLRKEEIREPIARSTPYQGRTDEDRRRRYQVLLPLTFHSTWRSTSRSFLTHVAATTLNSPFLCPYNDFAWILFGFCEELRLRMRFGLQEPAL